MFTPSFWFAEPFVHPAEMPNDHMFDWIAGVRMIRMSGIHLVGHKFVECGSNMSSPFQELVQGLFNRVSDALVLTSVPDSHLRICTFRRLDRHQVFGNLPDTFDARGRALFLDIASEAQPGPPPTPFDLGVFFLSPRSTSTASQSVTPAHLLAPLAHTPAR